MADPANRDKTGKFVKGVSGNPSGRKPIPQEFKELAEEYSIPALKKAIEIMNNDEADTKNVLKAIEIILDRGIGKPIQVNENHNTGQMEFVVVIGGDDD